MRENRLSGSEGGGTQTNASFLPLFRGTASAPRPDLSSLRDPGCEQPRPPDRGPSGARRVPECLRKLGPGVSLRLA